MRILLVPNSDWLCSPVASRLHFLFEEIGERHEVHVIRFRIPPWKKVRGTRLVLHDVSGLATKDLSMFYSINSPLHFKTIYQVAAREGIEAIVLCHILAGSAAIFTAQRRGVPAVLDYMDHFPESAAFYYSNPLCRQVVRSAVESVTRWNVRKATAVVTVSEAFRDIVRRYGAQDVTVIPNGVETEMFRSIERDEATEILRLDMLRDSLVVEYAGTTASWLDLDSVRGALRILNARGIQAVLLVVGGRLGTDTRLRRPRRVSPWEIHTGFVDYHEMPLYISASHVGIIPGTIGLTKNLTRPLKLLQFFACSRPVFSTPNAQMRQEFGDAITWYRDERELAELLMNFKASPEIFRPKIQKGLFYAQENSWHKMAKRYEDLVRMLLAGSA